MAEPSPPVRPGWSLGRKVGALATAYLALLYTASPIAEALDRVHTWWWDGIRQWPSGTAGHRVIDLLFHGTVGLFVGAYVSVFVAFVTLGPLALWLRATARRNVRAGLPDSLSRLRRWVDAHPRATRALTIGPAAAWSFVGASLLAWQWSGSAQAYERLGTFASMAIVAVVSTLALTPIIAAARRAFLSPTFPEGEQAARVELARNEIAFDAVALTPETRTALASMVALGIAAVALALTSPKLTSNDPHSVALLAAYAVLALGGAAAFRRGSRVAVGVDGVLVRGTSRTRFFAYRELDAVRTHGTDLELVRGERVVLRLQLHGEDAVKQSAVLARIRAAIDLVKEGRGAASVQLVGAATPAELARAASGGADYRGAALTRDQLWALVEGPEIGEAARRAAAEALAKTSGPEERARLRVAAEHCAAPAVRFALERLAEGVELERGDAPAVGRQEAPRAR